MILTLAAKGKKKGRKFQQIRIYSLYFYFPLHRRGFIFSPAFYARLSFCLAPPPAGGVVFIFFTHPCGGGIFCGFTHPGIVGVVIPANLPNPSCCHFDRCPPRADGVEKSGQ